MNKTYEIHEKPPLLVSITLALQHVFAMFGATVLVPALTGLDPAIALLTSGVGTLLFHVFTKGKVPAYLGSSFAYIAGLASMIGPDLYKNYVANPAQYGALYHEKQAMAMGAALIVGIIYILFYALIKAFGTKFITKYFPSVVVGPVVMIIGLSLSGVAIDMAKGDIATAVFTALVTILVGVFAKGFFKVIPILTGIIAGYIFAIAKGLVSVSEIFSGVPLFHAPSFVVPTFELGAITLLAPLVIVTIIEDLGHIFVIGNVTKKDLVKDPGFDNVLLGNGVATSVAAVLGGPPSTTYGENIGVLAVTKVFSSRVIQTAAVIAIVLSFIGPVRALVASIPTAVMGGVVVILFGMIAAAGIRAMVEAKTDLSSTRNLIIVSLILVLGIGIKEVPVALGNFHLSISGVGLGTLVGIFLNAILPDERPEDQSITTLESATTEETK